MPGQCRKPGRLNNKLGCFLNGIAEVKSKRARSNSFQTNKVCIGDSPGDPCLVLDHVKRPFDVIHSNRNTIVPISIIAQRIGNPAEVVGNLNALCKGAVIGRQFIL